MSILSIQALRYSIPALLGSGLLWYILIAATAEYHSAGGTPILLTFFALFLAPVSIISGTWTLLCTLANARQMLWHWQERKASELAWWCAATVVSIAVLAAIAVVFQAN